VAAAVILASTGLFMGLLDLSERTLHRHWRFIKAWLKAASARIPL